jgi:hypothetical protein
VEVRGDSLNSTVKRWMTTMATVAPATCSARVAVRQTRASEEETTAGGGDGVWLPFIEAGARVKAPTTQKRGRGRQLRLRACEFERRR